MGIKLELVLTVAIISIISGSLMVKLQNTPVVTEVSTKELEFTDTTLLEVDTNSMKYRAYTDYGIKEKATLTLDNIVYMSDMIDSLSANRGRFEENMLYLDNDVILYEKDGYKYETEHAVYDQNTEILNITSPFIAVRGDHMIHGKRLEYDTRKKKATGTTIETVFSVPDK